MPDEHVEDRREDLRRELDKEAYLLLQCKPAYFIPMDKLGVVEHVARSMLNTPLKRKRALELNNLTWVVKRLKLVPTECKIISVALGCLDTGEAGLFILCNSPTKLLADIPEEKEK